MTRKKQPGEPKKNGPKRTFTIEQLQQVEMLSKLGATNAQLAEFFGVVESSIDNWIKNHEAFKGARKRGGMEADMLVAQALYRRAIGYQYEEIKAIRSPTGNTDYILEVHKKEMAPDVKAAITWLSTRQRDTWAVTAGINVNHSGRVEHLHAQLEDIPVNELSDEAQDLLFEITQKQISNGQRDN